MSADEFRAVGHELVDWIASYLERVEDLPVRSQVEPGWVREQLPASPPEHGEPWDHILADLDRIVVPGLTHWQSPRFFGYFPANSSGPSVLGELLSAGLGVQGMLWSTSPACTELESHVLDWMLELTGLPDRFRTDGAGGGVIQDSASSATLCALVAARDRALAAGATLPSLRAYTSTQAHSSIEKGVRVAGLDPAQLVAVPADRRFAMDPEALRRSMDADAAAGHVPFLVVATAGTTSSTAFDPVPAVADAAEAHHTWLHVDAAYAGSAAVCPELRFVNDGAERADSWCFNPHKWLLTNFDCTLFYVADRRPLLDALGVLPEYLRDAASEAGHVIDHRDWQIPLGRRFRALKLWFVIRHYGAEGLAAHVRGHVALARRLAARVEDDDRFELAAPVPLGLVCFRHRGGDAVNQRILDTVNASGRAFLTHTRLEGKLTLRAAIGQTRTRAEHVDALWDAVTAAAP